MGIEKSIVFKRHCFVVIGAEDSFLKTIRAFSKQTALFGLFGTVG